MVSTLLSFALLLLAQPAFPGGDGGISPVPLDGGLSLLALAGGAYAMKRLRQRP